VVDVTNNPIQDLDVLTQLLLSCLCNSVAVRPNPPAHCCFRVGNEVAHDADLTTDLCCEGLAYVSIGEIHPVVASFRTSSTAAQANLLHACGFPSWGVSTRMGIVRCIPVGDAVTMPSCTDWNTAFAQHLSDAQALAEAVCCFKQTWFDIQLGMSVLVEANATTNPSGGCIERYVTMQIQTGACADC
jgi:hypothetical protein